MLRRDMSKPFMVSDQDMIERMSGEHLSPELSGQVVYIRLKIDNNGKWNSYFTRDRFLPNIERWKSFGWKVVSIDGKDVEDSMPMSFNRTFQPKPIERYRIAPGTDMMVVDPEGPYVLYDKVKDLIK